VVEVNRKGEEEEERVGGRGGAARERHRERGREMET